MLSVLKNLLIVVFLGGIVVLATIYSDTIKLYVNQQLQTDGKKVLGVSVQTYNNTSVSKEVQKEINSNVKQAQQQILQIKVSDILNSFSQARKIVHDVSGVQAQFKEELRKLSK